MLRYLAAFLAAFLWPAVALGQMACGPRDAFIEHMATNFNEAPAHMGVTPRGHVVEILVSPTGTWTLLLNKPTGEACMISSGRAWEDIPRIVEPEGEPS
jgi:hypothetical protein